MKCMTIAIVVMSTALVGTAAADTFNPFAGAVIDTSLNGAAAPAYLPAPGQWVNNSLYNDASKALGAPLGGGTSAANNNSVVSLGGFGGQIVLSFGHDVLNSPANAMGLDAIVFTNAFWPYADPQLHWAQLGTIEIMPELNGSGVAGDVAGEKWYVIPGSQLAAGGNYQTQTWNRTSGPQAAGTYPTAAGWPNSYTTGAHRLSPLYEQAGTLDGVVFNPNYEDGNPANDQVEGYYGYGGYSPTLKLGDRDANNSNSGVGDFAAMSPNLFYTTPDDPTAVGMTAGSGGGDAFDISWAMDPQTWLPASLASFRYIRVTTAVNATLGYGGELGEVSLELDGVADVREICDIDGDGVSTVADYDAMRAARGKEWDEAGFLPTADIVVDNLVDDADWELFFSAWKQVHVPGDSNMDGRVTHGDYTLWADNFGQPNASWSQGDWNGDGLVTHGDYTLWADNFGVAGMVVPEPATVVLLMFGAAVLGRRRAARRGGR